MAEASITINDVVFVVDCGKAKETTYDALNNTPCLLPSWISQASARQVSFIFLVHLVFLVVYGCRKKVVYPIKCQQCLFLYHLIEDICFKYIHESALYSIFKYLFASKFFNSLQYCFYNGTIAAKQFFYTRQVLLKDLQYHFYNVKLSQGYLLKGYISCIFFSFIIIKSVLARSLFIVILLPHVTV